VVSLQFIERFDGTKWFQEPRAGAKARLILRPLRHD
jgi:hypothetical protein